MKEILLLLAVCILEITIAFIIINLFYMINLLCRIDFKKLIFHPKKLFYIFLYNFNIDYVPNKSFKFNRRNKIIDVIFFKNLKKNICCACVYRNGDIQLVNFVNKREIIESILVAILNKLHLNRANSVIDLVGSFYIKNPTDEVISLLNFFDEKCDDINKYLEKYVKNIINNTDFKKSFTIESDINNSKFSIIGNSFEIVYKFHLFLETNHTYIKINNGYFKEINPDDIKDIGRISKILLNNFSVKKLLGSYCS